MLKLGIIGCGWLGIDVARKALDQGHQVIATSRSEPNPSIERCKHVKFNLGDTFPITAFEECDYILLALPVNQHNTFEKFSRLIEELESFQGTLIFTSSISVYNQEGENDEHTPIDSSNTNAQIEVLLQQKLQQTIILRLGGLIGKNRHPVYYLAGREVKAGNHKVNLVHIDDIVRLLFLLMKKRETKALYNVVHPNHPTKKDYYSRIANEMNLTPPSFLEDSNEGKVVIGTKLENEMKFKYLTEI